MDRTKQLFLHATRQWFPEDSTGKKQLVNWTLRQNFGDTEKLLPSKHEACNFYYQFHEGNKRLNELLKISPYEGLFNEDFSMYPDNSNTKTLDKDFIIENLSLLIHDLSQKINVLRKSTPENTHASHVLRDIALQNESNDIELALLLMKIAIQFNPSGNFIQTKIHEYEKKLADTKKL